MLAAMKAILCRRLGGPEVLSLEDVPEPALGSGRVRVRLTAAGVNFPDLLMVAGGYQLRPDLPFVPGMEAAGVVLEAAVDVTGWQAGTRVMVRLRPGAFQEQAVVSPSQLMALPDGLDDVHAAAFPIAYLTAWHALVQRGRLAAGEVVLVHGAAGGTGMAAVDVALRLGATVVAVACGHAARTTWSTTARRRSETWCWS
jgi:NADPH:quinone reductase